jgi:predicted dehydrogenase
MVTSPLAWGILSTANIGQKVVTPAIQSSTNSKVIAVASRNKVQASRYAEDLGIPKHYGDYQALLDDPEVTVIYNPLPNSLHLAWTLKALEAGKHVLCEKPLGLNAVECRQMAEAAEAANLILMEAFMYRFHDRSRKLFEVARDGTLGKLRLIRARFAFTVSDPSNIRLNAELGGGALMDVGCYCVNIARTLAGIQPLAVQGYATWTPSGVDETLSGMLRFEDGLIAQIDCALNQPRYETVQVFGTEGFIELESAFLPGIKEATLTLTTRQEGTELMKFSGHDQYQRMVTHFADCVVNEKAPLYGPLEAADNIAVIEALLASARQGGVMVKVAGALSS